MMCTKIPLGENIMNVRLFAATVWVCSFTYSNVALGQDFSSPYAGNGQAGLITNQLNITQTAITRAASRTTKKPVSIANRGKRLATLSFKTSLTDRKLIIAQLLQAKRDINPAAAQDLERFLGNSDAIGQTSKAMIAAGLSPNNVADAYTFYWTRAWRGVRGQSESLPRVQMLAVRDQVATMLLTVPQMTAATNGQKQGLAESMLIRSALVEAAINSAKSDPVLLEKIKASIAQGAKSTGLDVSQITLTSQGFRSVNK
jgi:hypothetical protein